jgi:hypothetical protein
MGTVRWITGPLRLNSFGQAKLLAAHFSEPCHQVGGTIHGKRTGLRGLPAQAFDRPQKIEIVGRSLKQIDPTAAEKADIK